MLRIRVRPAIAIPVFLFAASFVLGTGLRYFASTVSQNLVFASPLGLLWIAPLIWGRRSIWPLLAGSLLAALLAYGSASLVLAGLALAVTDVALGYAFSRSRAFPDGLNRIRDLLVFAGASAGPAAVRGALILVFAFAFELDRALELTFAAVAIAWFSNLVAASILLVPTGRWLIRWNVGRILELGWLLGALGLLMQYLFAVAGANWLTHSFASAAGLIVLETWLALRFHTRGMGLHRTLWFVLCSVQLFRLGAYEGLLPLDSDPEFCGQFALVLCGLLFAEMMIGAMASDRAIESESNAALTAELVARNLELEKLAEADRGQKAFLDSVLNQMPAGVMIVGKDGTILWRNQRHRDLWLDTTAHGAGLRDLKHNRISATKEHSVPFESWPIVKALTSNVVTEGFEARILSSAQQNIDVSISAAPVHDRNGELVGAVSILHDMSERKAGVRQLRDKEERLRFALQSARMIAYEWSIATQVIQTSEPLSIWLGLANSPLPTITDLLRVVHPNDLARFRDALGKLIQGGRECECEFRVPSAKGMLWVQCRGRRLVDEEGKSADRVAGIMIDVSERRRSEERLRMLESAVVHARDAVVILESEPNQRPGRCVLYSNAAFCEMTGYAAEELVGRSLHFLRGPKSDPATLERLRDALDSGDPFKGELLNYRRDGSLFWVEISVVPVPDSSGQCQHWVMIQRDISGRKRAEIDLQRSEAMLADAQRIAHVGSWEFYPLTGECTWSAEKIRIFGYDPLRFKPTVEVYLAAVHTEDREKVERVGLDAAKLEYPYRIEFRIVRPNGEIRFITEEYYADFDSDGSPVRFWGVTQDETEKKHAQEQLFQAQKMELIGQMAGGIAHDFNNLLTGIIGNLDRLIGILPEQDPNIRYVEIALRATNRAADLTKKLLGFARRNQLILHTTRVEDVVSEVVSFITRTFDPRIRVQSRIPDEHRMLADTTLISQVLLNLCLNARDAMPNGGRIELRSEIAILGDGGTGHPQSRRGEYVRLTVEDTGTGMSPEVLSKVFEPFFTTKPVGQGTGLGLAMVHGILTQHQGWVEVHSEQGQGTRFDLYLPRSTERPALPRKSGPLGRTLGDGTSMGQTPLPSPAHRQTILLVDDETMIRELGRAVLESEDYIVLEAEDGEDAVEMFRARAAEIDLVVLDLTMPKLSGQDTFHAMAEIDPKVRVLFSSGYSSEDLLGTEGALGLLPKPYRPQVLLDTVRRALAIPRGETEETHSLSRMPTPAEIATKR